MSASPLGPDTATLAVRFLGGLQVRQEGLLLPHPLPTRKTASLFAFLFLHPHAEHSRRFLADSFWPDVDGDAALGSLAHALVWIRRLLEPLPEQKGAFLVSHRDMLRLIPPPGCWVDVWLFQQARSAAQQLPVGSAEWFAALEGAVALYEGDGLLPDCGDDWCTALRDELQERLLDYLHQLTNAEEERRQYSQGSEWARRALAVDACDEESHRSLMRLYYRLGEYGKALNQYRECRRALRELLDAPPSAETMALNQWLRTQRDRDGRVPGPHISPIPDPPDLMVPLVGRGRELERLQAGWERARTGRGELILLTGEAGIGKSRLGRQLLQGAALEGGLTLWGQASALESSFLYRPLIDPLRRALELAAQHSLTLCAPVWLAQVARLLPELQHTQEAIAAPEGESPRLLEEGMAQLLLALAAQRPLCLFLDDLQWADAATGRFLHYLAHESRTRQARILLIGAYREGEVPGSEWLGSWVTEVEAQRMATSLPLARLNEEEVASLLQQLFEGQASEAFLRPLGERLHEETEGNPLFLLETVRDLFDRGYLERNEEGRWRIASELLAQSTTSAGTDDPENGLPLARRLPIPATVQRVVRQRVARLGDEDRQLLQCAAVIGRRFTFPALQRATGRAMDPTLEGVERLLAAHLISAQAHPAAFDFQHDKIREVVYEDLTPPRRQELHRRVGEALEAIYGVAGEEGMEETPDPLWFRRPSPSPARARAEEHAAELARHFKAAAPLIGSEKAARYYYLAGSRARALCAYEQAMRDLLTAHALLEELPKDEARLALLGQIIEQLAPAYRATDQRELAQEVVEDYITRCEQYHYGRGLARACTFMGRFLFLHLPPTSAPTSRMMYERAIAVCRAHGLQDWAIYPQTHLAYQLAASGADLEQAEELVGGCMLRAQVHQDAPLLQNLYTTLMWIATRRAEWQAVKRRFLESLAWGGPSPYALEQMLAEIEEACHQARPVSADPTFHELCREMAEGYTRAGLEPAFQQWHLEPTSPRPLPGKPWLQEEFTGEGWHPALTWQDATGRTRVDRATRPGWLGLDPPEDCDLWPEIDLNAPRLVATVRGDFVLQTRVELGHQAAVSAGLLVWRDERHFARLELRPMLWWRDDQHFAGQALRSTRWERAAVSLHACVAGRFRLIGRGHCERRPMWLRLERVGEELRGLCSADGERWLAAGSVRLPRGETEQVGLAAIQRGPISRAWFDQLLIWQGADE